MTRFDLVGCLISNEKAERARRKLKRRLKFLGELRDVQVQINVLEEHIEVYPELAGFLEAMRGREHQLASTVMDRVACMKTGKLKNWAGACRKDLAATPAGPHGQLMATRALHFLGAAFDAVKTRRQLIDPANSETLHSTRVAFKKFRYIVEALSPEFTGLGKPRLRRFATYQRRLGNLQDLEVLQGCIAQFLNRNPEAAVTLQRFSRHVATRRRHALRSCLEHVDDLFQFYFVPDLETPQPARKAA
jgi:CHAD domain-containing protein